MHILYNEYRGGRTYHIYMIKQIKGGGTGYLISINTQYILQGGWTTDIGSCPKNLGSDRQTNTEVHRGGAHLKIGYRLIQQTRTRYCKS